MTEGEELSARGIAEKIAADARMRFVCMKPAYDTIDLGEALITRFAEQARAPTATPSDEGWQPIETAPKDGTAVWLAVDSQSFIGYFDPARAYSDGDEGEWVIKASFRRVQNGCDEIAGRYWRKAVPTHWMPLPEPPSAIEGEKK